MQKNIQLQVPKPCHENWDKMNPTEKGKFCLSCQKEVIDFSVMTDKQILEQVSKSNKGFCGRFNHEQLNRDIKQEKKRRLTWYKYFVHVTIPALLFSNKLAAQEITTVGDTIICVAPKKTNLVVGKMALASNAPSNESIIKGRVLDEKGNPLVGVTVMIKGTHQGTTTNGYGEFSILSSKTTSSITLLASAVGFVTKELVVSELDAKKEKIILQMNQAFLGGAVVVGYTVTKKKTKPIIQQIKDTIVNICNKQAIRLYPNPIHLGSTLNIGFDTSEIGEYNIVVSNISGQPMMQKRINLESKNHIEQISFTENFLAGIYFVTVENLTSKKIFTDKILIN